MANGKFAEMIDPRLLEAAWHRFEAARVLANTRREVDTAKQKYELAANAHMKATEDYNNLEADITRGVRIGAGRAA